MLDLKKSILPQAVKVGGSFYNIHTDFKYILRFRELLQEKAPAEKFDFMYINNIPENRADGITAIYNFMEPETVVPRSTGEEPTEKVIDYTIDAPYIYAAFYEQYKIDLIKEKLHWYKFIALFRGLHDTELNRIISCRLYRPNGKNDEYEKSRQKQYEAWRLPQPEDDEPDADLIEFEKKLQG